MAYLHIYTVLGALIKAPTKYKQIQSKRNHFCSLLGKVKHVISSFPSISERDTKECNKDQKV